MGGMAMAEDRRNTFQLVGSLGILFALAGVAVYAWGWSEFSGMTPYLVGILSALLAAGWAGYERI